MKKTIISLASMAVIFAGCQTELLKESETTEKSASFEASTEVFEAQTKTSMTSDKRVVWSSGDKLAIFQGCSLADEYQVSEESVGKMNGTFARVSSAVSDDFSSGMEISCNIALYPYAEDLSLEGSVLDEKMIYSISGVELPAEQTYVKGSFGNSAFPMIAVTENMSDHTLKFKNVLGAMKLQLKGTQTVTSIKVEGKNNEILSGAATITAYANGLTPAITMTGTDEASKSVTLDCDNGVQLSESEATEFIIALPPVLFSQGFTVTVTDTEDSPVKTTNDPCPTGWRIPTYKELNALHTVKSAWTTNDAGQDGCYFSGVTAIAYDTTPENLNQVFFPAAGYRLGDAGYRGYCGYYWSSRPSSSYVYSLSFNSDYAGMSYDSNRASGYSVRCVQVTD